MLLAILIKGRLLNCETQKTNGARYTALQSTMHNNYIRGAVCSKTPDSPLYIKRCSIYYIDSLFIISTVDLLYRVYLLYRQSIYYTDSRFIYRRLHFTCLHISLQSNEKRRGPLHHSELDHARHLFQKLDTR